MFVRWLIASVLSLAIVSPAAAGVFKARGGKPAAPAPAKKDKPAAAAPAKKAPAKTAAAPAKKGPAKKSAVASTGRPEDLTPEAEPPAKKKKGSKESDVTITVEDGDDVIIRDIDD